MLTRITRIEAEASAAGVLDETTVESSESPGDPAGAKEKRLRRIRRMGPLAVQDVRNRVVAQIRALERQIWERALAERGDSDAPSEIVGPDGRRWRVVPVGEPDPDSVPVDDDVG